MTIQLPNITPDKLESLQDDIYIRKNLLTQRIETIKARYNCSLVDLERKLENLEIEEHPAWEDSIEWRNALEQLQN
jgi:hypothetical protein